MRIALVHCPIKHKRFSENLKVVDEEFCLAPPICLAYVAAILERAGHEVILVDAHALKLSKEKTLSIVKKFCPDLMGFRLDTYQFHQTLDWIRYLKQNINVPVVAGGINFLLYPKESLYCQEIDYGIIGEAVESLPRLLSAMQCNGDISAVEGVVYRDEGRIKLNSPSQKPIDFDSYPFPTRHLLPNEKYYSAISQRKNYTVMVTTKGCPYKCTFCAISRLPYLERSAENVIDEIEQCYRDYNIREIDFFDANFFLNRERTIKICQQLIKRKLKIEWSCRSRVDLVDKELLKAASMAGCRQIYYGIESANPQILARINKEVNIAQIERAIKLSREYGIRTLGFFMIGNLGEDRNTIKKTIRFMRQLKLDFVQVCRTIAKPGSDLDEILKQKTGRDYWRDYIIGKTAEERLPAPWTNLTQKEIEDYVKKAYYSFYFRLWYIFRMILRLKSFGELWRYLKIAIKMLFLWFSTDVFRKPPNSND